MRKKQKKVDLNKKSVVLLDLKQSYRTPYLIEEARKREWRFFALQQSNRVIPKGCEIIGAITDSLPDNPLCRKLRKLGCPVVRLGKLPHPQDHLQPVVLPDLLNAGIMTAEHYASRSFTHLGFIGHDPWGGARGLYEGMLKQSKDRGMELHLLQKQHIDISSDIPEGMERKVYIRNFRNEELKKWLKTLPKPIGILGYNCSICSSIDLLCNSLGISVPGEVSIVCYDDVPECSMSYTPLSAIDIGLKNVAEKAIELLSDIIDGNTPPESRTFVPPTGIILRQSTNILAVSDPAVAKALTYMWENLSHPISVEDIAEASGIHLRSLTRSFKKCLDRTMTEELLRKRLEKACELLRNDRMIVEDIAKAVGFDSKSYFYKRFQEYYGMTPVAFKAQKK